MLRTTAIVIVCVLAMLSITLRTYSEPLAQVGFDFARSDRGSLLGSFKEGLRVAVINGNRICTAKTGTTFQYQHRGHTIEATHMIGNLDCTKGFIIAAVGLDPKMCQIQLPETSP